MSEETEYERDGDWNVGTTYEPPEEYVPTKGDFKDSWLSYLVITSFMAIIMVLVLWAIGSTIGDDIVTSDMMQFNMITQSRAFVSVLISTAFWKIALIFTAILASTLLFAKIYQFPVLQIILISLGTLLFSFVLYHLVMYEISRYYPEILVAGEYGEASIELLGQGDASSLLTQIMGLLTEIFSYIYLWIWDSYRLDPSLEAYIGLYVLSKSFNGNIIVFSYDFIFVVLINSAIARPIINRLIRKCDCYEPAVAEVGIEVESISGPNVEYRIPSRCYPKKETISAIILILIVVVPIFTAMALPRFSIKNGVTDWGDYNRDSLFYTNNNVSFAGGNGVESYTTELLIDFEENLSLDTDLNFGLEYLQLSAYSRLTAITNGSNDIIMGKTYPFGEKKSINAYIPSLYAVPSIFWGYNYSLREDLVHRVQPDIRNLFDPSDSLKLMFCPSWWTDVWDNLEVVYWFGEGSNYKGYSLSNKQSADDTDLVEHTVWNNGTEIKVDCFEVNVSGSIRGPVEYNGSYYNETYCPGVKPSSDYLLIDFFGGSINFMGFNVLVAQDFLTLAQANENILMTLQQLPGWYQHKTTSSTACGYEIRVKEDFNLSKYLEYYNIPLIGKDGLLYEPQDCVSFTDQNVFLGQYYELEQTIGYSLGIAAAILVGISFVVFGVQRYTFEGEEEFDEYSAIYCQID